MVHRIFTRRVNTSRYHRDEINNVGRVKRYKKQNATIRIHTHTYIHFIHSCNQYFNN